jgi:hypothetical protein
MEFLKKAQEGIAAVKDRAQQEAEKMRIRAQQQAEEKQIEAELASPAGQARTAKANGQKIFQISLPLSETRGTTKVLLRGGSTTKASDHSSVLESIEAEGWRLEHASYVYQVTETIGIAAGRGNQAYNGEIIGIYIFRINEAGS